MSKYKVVKSFVDLNDDERVYRTGDVYEGSVAKKRLEELTTKKNKRGEVLIELIDKPKGKKKDA